MKHKTNLKTCRRETPLLQHDVAQLLNMDTTLYNRYEKGRRSPTLDIILSYHILFEAEPKDLFTARYIRLQKRIINQAVLLIEQLETEPTPKSMARVSHIKKIVKKIKSTRHD